MNDNQDIVIELTDVDGQAHRLRLLAVFEAGKSNRKYGAFITEDIMLYRYEKDLPGSDGKEFISEIPSGDYPSVSRSWSKLCQDGGMNPDDIRESVVYMVDEEQGDVAVSGSILCVFSEGGHSYAAICPHAIHFYRYKEYQNGGQDYVAWSNIELPQEYEEVSVRFNELVQDDPL
jgi:hypothetical protein